MPKRLELEVENMNLLKFNNMLNTKKLSLIVLLTLFIFPLFAENYNIIPEPTKITKVGEEVYQLPYEFSISFSEKELEFSANYLSDYIYDNLGFKSEVIKGSKFRADINLINLANGSTPGGYRINIDAPYGITIEGNDDAGVFYGVQTLIQLLPVNAAVLPQFDEILIDDEPAYQYRGLLLDVVRHFLPVSYVKKFIDYMALHKLNYFHWHLTDDQAWRIEMKSHPELTEIGSYREGEIVGFFPGEYKELPYKAYYTQDEIREVVEYAADRHITVIPELDIPGHCMAVLATYPHFATDYGIDSIPPRKTAQTWGIYNRQNNVLAPTPEVFAFLKDVFEEVCNLFPGQYVHFGGDECAKKWWEQSPKTQQFIKENSLADEKALQSYFVDYVQKVISSKGKIAIGWDEIIEGNISKESVIMNWHRPSVGVEALKRGHKVVFASSQFFYFNRKETRSQSEIGHRGPLSLENVYNFEIPSEGLTQEEKNNIIGVQACLWTEYLPTTWKLEYFLFPRISALSEVCWSKSENKSWNNFKKKMVHQFDRYDLWGIRYNDAFFRLNDIIRSR